jgi:hypothetical protein
MKIDARVAAALAKGKRGPDAPAARKGVVLQKAQSQRTRRDLENLFHLQYSSRNGRIVENRDTTPLRTPYLTLR